MRILTAALPAMLIAASGLAQERVTLSGGETSESHTLGFTATGADEAAPLVRGCPGFAEAGPAIVANMAAPGDLRFYLAGDGLAGALVVRPDGLHSCETPNIYGYASLAFNAAMAGDWAVHPLTATAGATVSGDAIVTSFDVGVRDVVGHMGLVVDHSILAPLLSEVPLAPLADPAFGAVALGAEGEVAVNLTLEGRVPADDAGPECRGLIDQTRPDARLTLAAEEPLLAVRAESEVDSTLLVMTPAGDIYCSDDALGYNPAVAIEAAAPGDYAVWVGVYSGGEGQQATLAFGRTAPEGIVPGAGGVPPEARLSPDAPPAYGTFGLPTGGATEVELYIGEGVLAGNFDGSCSGEIDPTRPDILVSVDAPAPLWLFARSDNADTTLVVVDPSGGISCNDDYVGSSAAVGIDPAEPGQYAVWVGAFGGGGGLPATLVVSQAPPDDGSGGSVDAGPGPDDGPDVSPFLGRDLPNALAAFDILREEPEFAAAVSWERLEETATDGFTLHGVNIVDPTGENESISVDRIAISDLDLEGMSATGAPEHFSISVEGVDYAAIARAAQAGGPPLPVLGGGEPLSFAASLLPADGDEAKRDVKLSLSLENQLGLAFAARMLWPDDVMALGPEFAAATAKMELVELTIDDEGFLGAALKAFAAESGAEPEQLIAAALGQLQGALGSMGPFSPESPRGLLVSAVSARLENLDAPGTINVRLTAPQPLDASMAFGQLMADQPDPSVVSVEIGHTAR